MALERRSNWRLFATCVCGLECATWQEECEKGGLQWYWPPQGRHPGGTKKQRKAKAHKAQLALDKKLKAARKAEQRAKELHSCFCQCPLMFLLQTCSCQEASVATQCVKASNARAWLMCLALALKCSRRAMRRVAMKTS